MNEQDFPFNSDEQLYPKNISSRSESYNQAIKVISAYLSRLGYQVAESVGIKGPKNQPLVIANLLAKNYQSRIEMACYVAFPKRKAKTSSKKISERALKLAEHWPLVAIFLVYLKPRGGTFPILARRLFKAVGKEKLRVFSLNETTGKIKGLFHWS